MLSYSRSRNTKKCLLDKNVVQNRLVGDKLFIPEGEEVLIVKRYLTGCNFTWINICKTVKFSI